MRPRRRQLPSSAGLWREQCSRRVATGIPDLGWFSAQSAWDCRRTCEGTQPYHPAYRGAGCYTRTRSVTVVAKAEQILEQLRALPPAERLRVVEQVVHEVAAEVGPQQVSPVESIWSDESDADFEAFRARVQ